MATDEKWDFISDCLDDLQKQHDRFDGIQHQLMISPESPLVDPFYNISDTLLKSLSLLINDNNEILNWFVYECDFGRSAIKAGRGNDMRLIDNHHSLRWLIEI